VIKFIVHFAAAFEKDWIAVDNLSWPDQIFCGQAAYYGIKCITASIRESYVFFFYISVKE